MNNKYKLKSLSSLILSTTLLLSPFATNAADHNDGPSAANDQGLDIADLYAFMDPGYYDSSQRDNVILILTFRGFITPGEAENMAFFQNNARFKIDIENTGDEIPDRRIEVTFNDRTGFRDPQQARVRLINLNRLNRYSDNPIERRRVITKFTAPTTIAVSDHPDPFFPPNTNGDFVVTKDPNSGISFFAGQTDDPFFFDVSGELQFRNSLEEAVKEAGIGTPPPVNQGYGGGFGDTNVELRGRDTFAGYNILSIALSVPKDLLLGSSGNVIGVSAITDRLKEGTKPINRNFFQVDRQGFPVINVVLLDYARKRAYNRATLRDDARQMFAGEIVERLMELGTNGDNIGILANTVVLNGDQLRLDTSRANPGPQGGTSATTGFVNVFGTDQLGNTVPVGGRRLADNAPDALVNIISNQQFVGANAVGNPGRNINNVVNGVPDVDLVPANDNEFRNSFPFLATPNQPIFPGANDEGITVEHIDMPTLDDGTRN